MRFVNNDQVIGKCLASFKNRLDYLPFKLLARLVVVGEIGSM